MKANRTFALLGAAMALTACGPKSFLQLGVHAYPQDVQLGSQSSPTPIALPAALGANLDLGVPGFLVPPVGLGGAGYGSAPCAKADPLAPTKVAATDSVSKAPKPGLYTYRQVGHYQVKGQPSIPYGDTTQILITPSRVGQPVAAGAKDPTDSSIYWDQEEKTVAPDGSAVAIIDYTYRLVPNSEIDFYAITIRKADGTTELFQPQGPDAATYIQFPASDRPSWTHQATDELRQVTFMDAATYAGPKDRVDACGTWIDSFRVDLGSTTQVSQSYQPPGGCLGPFCVQPSPVAYSQPEQHHTAGFQYQNNSSQDYTITGWYDIATQLNGLLVAENIVEKAVDGGWTNSRTLYINSAEPSK